MNKDYLKYSVILNTKKIILARISDRKKKIAQDYYDLAKIENAELQYCIAESYIKLAVENDPDNRKYLIFYDSFL